MATTPIKTPNPKQGRCRSIETPNPKHGRSKSIETLNCENHNPNIASCFSSPPSSLKSKKSPCSKSVPAKKSVSKTLNPNLELFPAVPRPGRKFIVRKKTLKRKDGSLDFNKCRAEAYEALRASQEEFFRKEKSEISKGVEAFDGQKNGSGPQLSETVVDVVKNEICKDQKSRSGKKSENEICKDQRCRSGKKSENEICKDQKSRSGKNSENENCKEQKSRSGKKSEAAFEKSEELKSHQITEDFEKSEPKVDSCEELGIENLEGSSKVRKMRSITMNKAINTMPDPGLGRVKHLVQAFESLQLIKKEQESEKKEEEKEEEKEEIKQKVINWALPGLIGKPTVSLSSSAEFISFAGLERESSMGDNNSNRSSWESRTTGGGRRSRRSSSDSLRSWNRKLKVTSQHPFKLRTEQRGRKKEEQFIKKVEEMLIEEQKMRIPLAQGLPWTTDEPQCLVKPPVKERTEPIELVLHSDVRAVERAEFDNFVTERLKYAEELRLDRERQRKLEEEEEIKRLRKELVPKAQPMPYFDRPFIPKKSAKPITVPKEPTFLVRPGKLSCVSSSSMGSMIEFEAA